MNPWWLGLDPAQATITCGEHSHRLRWEKGALQAIDHEDPEAERALAALGGERCACMEVLDAWSHHEGDPRVLVLASRGPADPLAARADWTAQLGAPPVAAGPATAPPSAPAPRRQFLRRPARRRATAHGGTGYAPLAPRPLGQVPFGTQAESELIALLGLGGGVQDRLVATVAGAWAQRWEHGDPAVSATRPMLHASMHGRLCAVMRTWLGRVDIEVELDLIDAREAPTLTEIGGVIRAELPFAWLGDVWSRGLATVMGRLCLAASTADGRTWALTTVGPDLGSPAPVTIELPAA
jgi:hypothetical protein